MPRRLGNAETTEAKGYRKSPGVCAPKSSVKNQVGREQALATTANILEAADKDHRM